MAGLSTAQKQALDRDNRQIAGAGYPLSQVITDLFANVSNGSIGITSNGADVDSLALGGGTFTNLYDPTAPSLSFPYGAGRFHNGKTLQTVAAGSVLLAASSTNYVELDRNGTVSGNTTGFTSGRMPLYQIVTGTGSITTITSTKALLTLIGPAGVDGSMLSTAASTQSLDKQIGAVAATASFAFVAPVTGKISGVTFVNSVAVATSDTDNWTFALVNKGPANAGTQQLLNTGNVNSTKATGGSALAAYTPRALTLTTLSVGNELNVNAGDCLVLTITATGAPTALANADARVDIAFTG